MSCLLASVVPESLRDIVICLAAHRKKTVHLGFQSAVYLPTWRRTNERRDWRIIATSRFAHRRSAKMYADDKLPTLEISEAVYTCLIQRRSNFVWRFFLGRICRDNRGRSKCIWVLSLHGNMPSFFDFLEEKRPYIFWTASTLRPRAYYVFDRGYHDFGRFFKINGGLARTCYLAPKQFVIPSFVFQPGRREDGGSVRSESLSSDTSLGEKYPAQLAPDQIL